MATPEPPDFKEVPNPMEYIPSSTNPASSFDSKGVFKGPRVAVTRTEGGTTVVTTDTKTAPSYFMRVSIEQVNNGWLLENANDPCRYAEQWVFTCKADLAKFIVDRF